MDLGLFYEQVLFSCLASLRFLLDNFTLWMFSSSWAANVFLYANLWISQVTTRRENDFVIHQIQLDRVKWTVQVLLDRWTFSASLSYRCVWSCSDSEEKQHSHQSQHWQQFSVYLVCLLKICAWSSKPRDIQARSVRVTWTYWVGPDVYRNH